MISAPNLVLLEGDDDLHFFLHLLNSSGFEKSIYATRSRFIVFREDESNRIELKQKGGYEKLIAELTVELIPSDLRRVAIIADANGNPEARWQSVLGAVSPQRGVNTDPRLRQSGIVLPGPRPIGIWLMPDCGSPGFIEDFVLSLVDETDSLVPRARLAVDSIPSNDRLFPSQHVSKAYLHTWLAWQNEPGTRMAQAVTRNYLQRSASAASAFLSWFDRWLAEPPQV